MEKGYDEVFEELCKKRMATETKIEFTEKEDKDTIRIEGFSPMLFNGACEIVRQLAIQEGNVKPGIERLYVKMLCKAVLETLNNQEEK